MNWQEYITIDPKVCRGQPCLHGTRILVSTVAQHFADGMSVAEILTRYPVLTYEAIRAALAYTVLQNQEPDLCRPD